MKNIIVQKHKALRVKDIRRAKSKISFFFLSSRKKKTVASSNESEPIRIIFPSSMTGSRRLNVAHDLEATFAYTSAARENVTMQPQHPGFSTSAVTITDLTDA